MTYVHMHVKRTEKKPTEKKKNSKTHSIIRKTRPNLNWINPYLHSLRLCNFPLIFPQECLIKSESRTCLLWVVSGFLFSGEISFFFSGIIFHSSSSLENTSHFLIFYPMGRFHPSFTPVSFGAIRHTKWHFS